MVVISDRPTIAKFNLTYVVLEMSFWKIGQIAVGCPLDRESIYLHIFVLIVPAYVLCATIDTLEGGVVIEWLSQAIFTDPPFQCF